MTHRPIVTLAAEHGAAGDIVAPRVADALGVPYLDRALPASLATASMESKRPSGLVGTLARASTMLAGEALEREGIGAEVADRRVREHDRARKEYLRRAFGVEPYDRTLYHLVIDTTALSPDASVDLVITAARSRIED